MESVRSSFSTQDGTKIFSQYWRPESPRAVVVQVHGLGEHSGRYAHVAAFLGREGIALYAFDHRGHGLSDGKRGHVPSYESLMEEIDLALAEAEKLFPGLPKFLYGHSWGGNIALNYLIRRQPKIKAAIVTDPWLHIPPVPAFKEKLGRFMNNILPGLTQDSGLKSSGLSRDPKVVAAYDNDPLVHGKISVRLFVDSDAAAHYALGNASKVNVPLLLMHGGDDPITLKSGSEAFQKGLKGKNSLKIWPGLLHEIHNEPEQGDVLKMMRDFVLAEM
ncbi:MAG: lysophospholipase [Bacteroidia bacterium]|nr:lysophospholipase [Bacteroidia bacterium]